VDVCCRANSGSAMDVDGGIAASLESAGSAMDKTVGDGRLVACHNMKETGRV
jgi:hypothetical protein